MRATMLSLAAALGIFAAHEAQATTTTACVDSTSHPYVAIPRFDPFGGTGATRNFTLSVHGQGSNNHPAYVQFVDHEAIGGGGLRIGGDLGPYSIVAATGQQVVVPLGDLRSPGASVQSSPWVSVPLSQHGAMLDFQLQVNPDTAPAGVYDQVLDLRVACPSSHGGYDYVTIPDVAEIHVAVDDIVKLVGDHSPTLDLGDLAVDGSPAVGQELVGVRASGPFNVDVRSQGGVALGAAGGMLVRTSTNGSSDDDRIPYQISVQGLAMNGAQGRYRCGDGVGAVAVAARTGNSPGNGKHAGIYRDTIEVTLTPDFLGSSVDGSHCTAR